MARTWKLPRNSTSGMVFFSSVVHTELNWYNDFGLSSPPPAGRAAGALLFRTGRGCRNDTPTARTIVPAMTPARRKDSQCPIRHQGSIRRNTHFAIGGIAYVS